MQLRALDDPAWESPWRAVRVGDKVAVSGALVLTALLGPVWPTTVLVAAVSAGLALAWARVPVRALGVAVAAPMAFLVLAGGSVSIVLGGEPSPQAWTWGPVWADAASLARGAGAFAHGVAGTLAIMLLATTTPMVDLLGWLRRLGVPAPLVEIASLIYRLLFVLLGTALAMRAAQTARMADVPRGRERLRRGYATAGTTIGALLVRSWDHAARLQEGLEGRGYVDDLRVLAPEPARSRAVLAGGLILVAAIWIAGAWSAFGGR